MRVFTNGRGVHPEIDSTCAHMWTLDESSGTATIKDLMGAYDLATITGTPAIRTDSDIGFAARGYDGSTSWAAGVNSGADMSSNKTVFFSVRLASGYAADGHVAQYNNTGSATVSPFALLITSTRTVRVYWHTSAGTYVPVDFTTITLPTQRWIHGAVTVSVSGTATVSLYLGGTLAATLAGYSAPTTVASTQRWAHAATVDGAQKFTGDISHLSFFTAAKSSTQVEDQLRRMRGFGFETWCPLRCRIADKAGAWVDVSTDLPGADYLNSASYKDDVDSRMMTASVSLWRSQGRYSLAKYSDNALNRYPLPSAPSSPGPDSTTYVAPGAGAVTEMLALDRPLELFSCRMPVGVSPTSTDWQSVFSGYIDNIDWGGEGDTVQLECRDLGARIKDAHVMTDELYGSTTGTPIETVSQSILTDAASTAKVPRWGLQTGWPRSTTAPTLSTGWTDGSALPPVSPSWSLRQWRQSRVPVLDALNTLAEQIGFVCRYRYVGNAWVLQLYEPPRLRTYSDAVLTDFDVKKLSAMKISKENIRTMVRVCYYSRETISPTVPTIATGTTTKAVGTVTAWHPPVASGGVQSDTQGNILNPASFVVYASDLDASELGASAVTEFGIIPCEIAEPPGANIDSITEAQKLAVAVLRDLCFPKADVQATFAGMPELELHDSLRLRANNEWATADLDLSVVGLGVSLGSDEETTIQMRGAPCGGHVTQLARETRAGNQPPATNPLTADVDMPRRLRRGIQADLAKNSVMIRSNLRTILNNGDFSARSLGANPPDGWTAAAGAFGTDLDVETSTVESGPCSVKFANNTGVLQSSTCMVNASTVLQLEARVRVSAASITSNLDADFLDANGNSLGISSLLSYTPSATNTWYTARAQYQVPASARYFRLRLRRSGAGVGNLFFDRVQVTPLKPAFLCAPSATQTITDKAIPAKVQWGTKTYDWGGNFDSTTNHRFTCPEAGFYEFSAYVQMQASGGVSLGVVALYKNGSLWIGGQPTGGTATGGAKVPTWGGVATTNANWAQPRVDSGTQYLSQGDYIEVYAYSENSTAANGVVQTTQAGFTGRLISVE